MNRVLVVFPTSWDRKQLSACRPRWADEYEILFAYPDDEDCPWDLDPVAFIESVADDHRGRLQGVMSSSDYPGATIAGAVAMRLGLPGSPPDRIIGSSHKYSSRLAQREVAPEATPDFHLLDPRRPDELPLELDYPCFVKPVKGAYSVMARKIASRDELRAFLRRPAVLEFTASYMRVFNQLVRAFTDFEIDGGYFLAEEYLRGEMVTLEGYCQFGEIEILGIVDSVLHPVTRSFVRFDYPSRLPAPVRARMEDVARRVVRRLGLESTLFNIEMAYDADNDRISIIEINPRLSGQFGDLYQKVDGTNSYEIALALATGRRPALRRGEGAFRVASSFPLRVFHPSRVLRAPDARDVRQVQDELPGTLVWLECTTGQELSDFEGNEDGLSYRYGIINLGGECEEDVTARREKVYSRLGFELVER